MSLFTEIGECSSLSGDLCASIEFVQLTIFQKIKRRERRRIFLVRLLQDVILYDYSLSL